MVESCRDLAIALAMVSAACGGTSGTAEVSITRTAELKAQIVAVDGRIDVPCAVTPVLFGADEPVVRARSGQALRVDVEMVTPWSSAGPVKALVALRVLCDGYAPATVAERDIEVGSFRTRKTDLGTITVQRR